MIEKAKERKEERNQVGSYGKKGATWPTMQNFAPMPVAKVERNDIGCHENPTNFQDPISDNDIRAPCTASRAVWNNRGLLKSAATLVLKNALSFYLGIIFS